MTRQIYAGAGKVGSENRGQPCDYQLSQRADFFETEVALDTMVKRPSSIREMSPMPTGRSTAGCT